MEQSPEYFSVETAELIKRSLSERSTLPMTWVESRIFEELYSSLSKYMNRLDLIYALGELRQNFLSGFTSTTLPSLHQTCKRCRLCKDVKHPAENPVWTVTDPDLMIVVENPTVFTAYESYLITQLKRAGFKGNRCMVTYMTRCPIFSQDIRKEHIANCIGYLHTEMQASNPKLILTLGSKTWGALTGDTTHKISELERNIAWFGMYPILPGMSLAWYARNAEGTEDVRLYELLVSAYNFLYTDSQVHDTSHQKQQE